MIDIPAAHFLTFPLVFVLCKFWKIHAFEKGPRYCTWPFDFNLIREMQFPPDLIHIQLLIVGGMGKCTVL